VNKGKYLRDMKIRFRLTERETDALRCLLDGMKNADIAQNLMIAEQTVKDHLGRVYKKMGVKNRFELMRSLVKSSGRKARAHISAPVPAERELTEPSVIDELTGTYNRRAFLALAEQQIKIARRQKKNVCMLHAEVERSKTITDTSGPNSRDVLLKDAANILRDTFRESDVIARVGGVEFVVIPLGATGAEADRVVARLQESIALFNSKRNDEHALSISYDTSLLEPGSPCRVDELLRGEDGSTDKVNSAKDERENGPLKR
jgi:diguanylate cyclase (GGDEF)-like protein